MQSTLDESLLAARRGARPAPTPAAADRPPRCPSWALGAADVRIVFITAGPARRVGRRAARLPRPSRSSSVVGGARAASHAHHRGRRASASGRGRAGADPGQALVIAQSLAPRSRCWRSSAAVILLFGVAGVVLAGIAGWGVARNGLRPVRRLTGAVEDIARTERAHPAAGRGRRRDRPARHAFNQMLAALERLPRPAAPAGRRRRPRAAHPADVAAHQHRPAQPGRLRDGTGLQLPPEAREELLDDVRAQIEELTTLIGDLVELARDEPLDPRRRHRSTWPSSSSAPSPGSAGARRA